MLLQASPPLLHHLPLKVHPERPCTPEHACLLARASCKACCCCALHCLGSSALALYQSQMARAPASTAPNLHQLRFWQPLS